MHEGLLTNKMKAGIIGASLLATTTLLAEEKGKDDPGASDTEIKICQTMPYSGPVSAFSAIGKVQAAISR
jgi:branched-chain amino acid transport system substrate-binding protein